MKDSFDVFTWIKFSAFLQRNIFVRNKFGKTTRKIIKINCMKKSVMFGKTKRKIIKINCVKKSVILQRTIILPLHIIIILQSACLSVRWEMSGAPWQMTILRQKNFGTSKKKKISDHFFSKTFLSIWDIVGEFQTLWCNST